MKNRTVFDLIDSGHMVLAEFQRGYVRTRDQVRGLFDSHFRGHRVAILLHVEGCIQASVVVTLIGHSYPT